MGLKAFTAGLVTLLTVIIPALVLIPVLVQLGNAFAPFDGQYAWEITGAGISALLGCIGIEIYKLKAGLYAEDDF